MNTILKERSRILELILIFSGQLFLILIGISTIKILTNVDNDGFGFYSLILSITALLSSIFYGPAEQSFVRFLFTFRKYGILDLLRSNIVFFFTLISCVLLFASLLYFALFNNTYLTAYLELKQFIILVLFIIFSASSQVISTLLNALEVRGLNLFLSLIERIILFCLFIYFNSKAALNIHLVFNLSTIVLSLFFFIKMISLWMYLSGDVEDNTIMDSAGGDRTYLRQMLEYALPYVIWGFGSWLQGHSDRWFLSVYCDLNVVASFVFCSSLVNYMISMPVGILVQYYQPLIFSQIINSKKQDDLVKGYRMFKSVGFIIILLILISFLFCLFFGHETIELLSNSSYANNYYLLPYICISIGLFQLGQFLTLKGALIKKPQIYLLAKLVPGLFSIIFYYVGIEIFDFVGVLFGMILTNLIYLLLVIKANTHLNNKIVLS